jgi:GT2 family glycosyltransferase
MISVIVCSTADPQWKDHEENVAATIGCEYEYLRIDNRGGHGGICAAYNEGIERAGGDPVVFVHEDVFFLTPAWGRELQRLFEDASVGMVGVAGTQYLFRHLPFWGAAGRPFIHGCVVHAGEEGKKDILTVFSRTQETVEVVAVDGLFFALGRDALGGVRFDAETFDRYHFYDIDMCMQVRRSHRILVTPDIMVKHFSGGSFDEEWARYAARFMKKYARELPAGCSEAVPDPEKRVDFESCPVDAVLRPEAAAAIRSVGSKPGAGSR